MQFLKKIPLISVAVILTTLLSTQAMSHGSHIPLHGGEVKIIGEMSFELAVNDRGVQVFLIDDGDDVDTSKLKAKLKVRHNGEKSEITLKPSGGNSLTAAGATLPSDAKVLVLVTLADGYSKIGANFKID